MTENHDAWLIDLDGTLYHSLPVKLAMAAELCLGGPTVWRTISQFRKQHEKVREQAQLDADPFTIQLEATAKSLKQSVEKTKSIVTRWMIERPGKWLKLFRRSKLLNRIAIFRANGGRTALVSDYPASQKLAAMQADDLFDVVVASGEADQLQSLKPNPASYLLAAQKLDIVPDRCLVIGDRQDADGLAASNAGMSFEMVG
jgi:FMN phosphatase YigB (HAD superfamily)